MKRLLQMLALAFMASVLPGCPEEDSPAEELEDSIDDAGDEVEDAIEDAGDEVEEATDG